MLEEREAAIARGATVLGELVAGDAQRSNSLVVQDHDDGAYRERSEARNGVSRPALDQPITLPQL